MLTKNKLEELAEISCDRTLKISFVQQQLSKFWLTVASKVRATQLVDRSLNLDLRSARCRPKQFLEFWCICGFTT